MAIILTIIFMLIPEGISYGLYNLIDPITEMGRIISIIALVSITIPFAIWFVILGVGLFVFLATALDI